LSSKALATESPPEGILLVGGIGIVWNQIRRELVCMYEIAKQMSPVRLSI